MPTIPEINHWHIMGYLEAIKRRGVAPRTVKGRFGAIHTFLEWAVQWEIIESSADKSPRIKPGALAAWGAAGVFAIERRVPARRLPSVLS